MNLAPPKPRKQPGSGRDNDTVRQSYDDWLNRVDRRASTGNFSSKRVQAEEAQRKAAREAEARAEYEAWLLKKSHHDRAVQVGSGCAQRRLQSALRCCVVLLLTPGAMQRCGRHSFSGSCPSNEAPQTRIGWLYVLYKCWQAHCVGAPGLV